MVIDRISNIIGILVSVNKQGTFCPPFPTWESGKMLRDIQLGTKKAAQA